MCVDYNENMKRQIVFMGQERIEWTKLQGRAGQKVRYAVKNGELINLKEIEVLCVDCGRRATMYDHQDYTKPLDVQPVCASCNYARGTNAPIISGGQNMNEIVKCPNCGSSNIYVRIDGTVVCRKCGHISKLITASK